MCANTFSSGCVLCVRLFIIRFMSTFDKIIAGMIAAWCHLDNLIYENQGAPSRGSRLM